MFWPMKPSFRQLLAKPLLWLQKVFPLFAYLLSVLVLTPWDSSLRLKWSFKFSNCWAVVILKLSEASKWQMQTPKGKKSNKAFYLLFSFNSSGREHFPPCSSCSPVARVLPALRNPEDSKCCLIFISVLPAVVFRQAETAVWWLAWRTVFCFPCMNGGDWMKVCKLG